MFYVYLHGFCSSYRSKKGTWFKEHFQEMGLTLHTPDLNGDFTHMTISSQLKIVEETLAALPQGEICLMGSSLGAWLSVLYAGRSQRVTRLVLIAPAFRFATRYLEGIDKQVLARWRETKYINIFHYGYEEERPLHAGIIEDARSYDSSFKAAPIPALIFHGLDDRSVPYQLSIDYLAENPQAQLMLLNSDHGMTDDVQIMWRYMRSFLKL